MDLKSALSPTPSKANELFTFFPLPNLPHVHSHHSIIPIPPIQNMIWVPILSHKYLICQFEVASLKIPYGLNFVAKRKEKVLWKQSLLLQASKALVVKVVPSFPSLPHLLHHSTSRALLHALSESFRMDTSQQEWEKSLTKSAKPSNKLSSHFHHWTWRAMDWAALGCSEWVLWPSVFP